MTCAYKPDDHKLTPIVTFVRIHRNHYTSYLFQENPILVSFITFYRSVFLAHLHVYKRTAFFGKHKPIKVGQLYRFSRVCAVWNWRWDIKRNRAADV